MEVIIFCIGLALGAIIMNLAVEEERRINKKLMKTINNLESDLDNEILKVGQKDLLIKDYQYENVILLQNSAELRTKIKDLENNIELLTYNIPELNKELVSEHQSQN